MSWTGNMFITGHITLSFKIGPYKVTTANLILSCEIFQICQETLCYWKGNFNATPTITNTLT